MQFTGGEESSPIFLRMEHNLKELQSLREPQFNAAKRWWTAAIISRLLVVAVSVVSVFATQFVTTLALLAGGFTVLYTMLQWRSDSLRSTADSILRRTEFADGLRMENHRQRII